MADQDQAGSDRNSLLGGEVGESGFGFSPVATWKSCRRMMQRRSLLHALCTASQSQPTTRNEQRRTEIFRSMSLYRRPARSPDHFLRCTNASSFPCPTRSARTRRSSFILLLSNGPLHLEKLMLQRLFGCETLATIATKHVHQ